MLAVDFELEGRARSWQVFPAFMIKMLQDKNRAKADRAMKQMMQMKKLDFAPLKKAFEGK